ncbi:MAG TPA: pantoate--beta-alanine ligase, partial [Aeromicrobium sp.]|nr:pantoate--beta-alanine ligase [Aeromicrobium sp.]
SAPTVVRTPAELRELGGGISLVPTMGALHDGHIQLMKHARPLGQTLVASIFVNPTQFAPGEDFEDYPRTFEADLERCAEAGVDVVFAPTVQTMFPQALRSAPSREVPPPLGPVQSEITVDPGPLGTILEGASRPTHFRGVLTVVSKLFGLVRPDVAVFGEKDYQQLVLIRQMNDALCLGIDVQGCPTVRDADGLAMSSRNVYLTPEQRQQAPALYAALRAGAAASAGGADAVLASAHAVIDQASGVDLDYLELRSADLGEPTPGDARLLIAARVGKPRLLDNIHLTLPPEGN